MIKNIIAKEWLLFLLLIFFGIVGTFIIYFIQANGFEESRKILYNGIQGDPGFNSFEEFSTELDNPAKRLEIYYKISEKYDLGTYESYEWKITNTKFEKSITNFYEEEITWQLLFILIPYIFIQVIRSINWSLQTLKNKNAS